MARNRTTIADVARLANVSMGTVSNVLNGTAGVRPATRARVEAAVTQLNFHPNAFAQSLSSRARRPEAREGAGASPRLVAVGYTSVDYTARVAVMPHRDDRITASSIEKSLGGPAANVAVIAAGLADRFPLAVELVTAIGDDADSNWALAELTDRNVDTIAVRRTPGQRLSRCIVLVEPNGARTVINEPFELEDSDLERYVGQVQSSEPRCICIEGFQVERMMEPVLAMRSAGWRIAIQTTGLPADRRNPAQLGQMLRDFDVVFINRQVARDVTDCRGGEKQLIDAVVNLVGSVPARAIVVFTLGERGALVIAPGEAAVHISAKAVEIVDVTGNGGALAGTFLAAWLHTDDPILAAEWGTAAGSFITAVPGALGTVPTAGDLQALIDRSTRTIQLTVAS